MKTLALSLLLLFTSHTLCAEEANIGFPAPLRPGSLPSAFDSFTLTHGTIVRSDSGEVNYKIRINAHLPMMGMIDQIHLRLYPNLVLIDKARNVGVFEEKLDARGADVYLETGGAGETRPFPGGIYFLSIRLRDGAKTEGWFILNGSLSPVGPDIRSPAVGQTFNTGNPRLSWRNFRSPEYLRVEKRKLYARVFSGSHAIWGSYLDNANTTRVTVGKAPSQEGVESLDPGFYEAHIVYRELVPAGPMWFGREYRTIAPFSVR